MARQLTATMAVAGQLTAAGIQAAVAGGARLILNNRPDGEEPGQPTAAALAEAAAQAGLTYVHIPISPGRFTQEMIDQTRAALAACDGLALAFCRSGARSTALWAMAQAADGHGADGLIATAANAGYDISGLEDLLRGLAGEGDLPR